MQNIKIEIKWAVIFILVGLAWMVLERAAGLHDEHIDQHAIYTNLFAIAAIAVYVFALLDKRKNFYNGVMTYKQGLMTGLVITLFVTLLTPLWQWLTVAVITPDYFQNARAYAVETGQMNEEQAEVYFSINSYIIQSVVFTPVMGLLTSAIVALFTRRKVAPQT